MTAPRVAIRREGTRHPTAGVRRDARRLLRALAEREPGLAEAELSVVLCDDPFIQDLNRAWRKVDAPTDVLSFPQDDPVTLGDVVISVDTAARQAAEQGHPLARELRVLLVHGLLHLLGHDHHTPAEAARMRAEEERLLAGLDGRGEGLVLRAMVAGGAAE